MDKLVIEKIEKNIKNGTLFQKVIEKFYWLLIAPVAKVIVCVFSIKPNKVVVDNFRGRGFGEDPKYIVLEILRQNKDWDVVWLLKDLTVELPEGVRKVKYGSIQSFYELATAKVWIDNVRNTARPRKKRNQIYLQTWHGGFIVKKIEKEIEDELGRDYVRAAKYDGSICDAITADNSLMEEIIRENFWLSPHTEVLRYGIPRNDIFFNQEYIRSAKVKAKNFFHLPDNSFVILYAPTFRDDNTGECYNLDFESIVQAFARKAGRDAFIIIKLHPNALIHRNKIQYSSRVIDGSLYPDIQEMYCLADTLLSDYSSTPQEFAVFMKKPAFLCTLDYKEYLKNRELKCSLDDYPFPHANTSKELVDAINSVDLKELVRKQNSFFDIYNVYDSGEAAKQIVAWIEKKI